MGSIPILLTKRKSMSDLEKKSINSIQIYSEYGNNRSSQATIVLIHDFRKLEPYNLGLTKSG